MTHRISVAKLRNLLDIALANESELAILDVREAGQYAAGHLFFATHLPYSRLEVDIGVFVPRLLTPVVIYDSTQGIAEKARSALIRLGYTNVSILDGGTLAWVEEGHTLFEGVNLPSKTFGELVEHKLHTPRLSPDELTKLQKNGTDLIILDGRTAEEYVQFNIPGGISCPNAELALRLDDLVHNQDTIVVINCAGRTRSIIGAQTLINFGVPNKTFALENGTQGWALSDRELEYGATRYPPKNVKKATLLQAKARAQSVSERFNVSFIDADTLEAWRNDDMRTVFILDVRARSEYLKGHLAGSRHAPGGQLVQATDRWIGVRGARVVVCDDTEVRAICTAHWLKQMGWDVYVLQGGIGSADLEEGDFPKPKRTFPKIDVTTLLALINHNDVSILDLRKSTEFEKGHIEGAQWLVRPFLEKLSLVKGNEVVLIADDYAEAALVANDLANRPIKSVSILDGGMKAWREAGGNITVSTSDIGVETCIDFVAFTAERHGGNKDHMRQYLEWETNLINRLDDQERGTFKIMAP